MSPFTEKSAEAVTALGEAALLLKIRQWLGDVSPASPWGMGDDCAVLDTSEANPLLATTDGVIYGRHFDDSATPESVGEKVLKRNLSDVAAMGGRPGPALLNLVLARNTAVRWVEKFYRGLKTACEKYGVLLIGGDLSQGPDNYVAAHVTLIGVPGPAILKRTGAQIGDALYVTGELGGSILGKHLQFTPRLAEGQWLAQQKGVRSSIDLTDGLAKDLPELLPTDADARLDAAALPISAAAKQLSQKDGQPALLHSLTDGEDYELLFALDAKIHPTAFESQWREAFSTPLTLIGTIVPASEKSRARQLRDVATGAPLLPPDAHGYEHWR